ncbi:hypothetical protein ACIPRL_19100 [Streptomyces sp. NPDC090085]|uniref:hypothetical protein n=1 Tax=Streptomyces sp. NPDC090085 TaxID=3365943 RepID=UPI003829DB99
MSRQKSSHELPELRQRPTAISGEAMTGSLAASSLPIGIGLAALEAARIYGGRCELVFFRTHAGGPPPARALSKEHGPS